MSGLIIRAEELILAFEDHGSDLQYFFDRQTGEVLPRRTTMKTCLGLFLAILALIIGCAPGYYGPGPAYPEAAPAYRERDSLYQNPETDAEQDMRIWREESGR
jgi:hypothetical protein